MSNEEIYLLDFLYRLIEQGIHKIYDDDLNDLKVCDLINLIEKQQTKIENQQTKIENQQTKIEKALDFIFNDGQFDGAHHKAWAIDQIAQILGQNQYKDYVKNYKRENGTEWDTGIVP